MTSQQIRQQFIDFFKSKRHLHLPESSLVPENDPSVLLTPAGMQQFKPYFSYPDKAPAKRITTVQPSFRTTDIDNVGDESHNTFFEMLGNFSFGYAGKQVNTDAKVHDKPYFKEEAIKMAWELMTEIYKIDQKRIYVTVFGGDNEVPRDEESIEIWRSLDIPAERIKFGNREDNFWGPTGEEGPCGPTTEIYVDGVEVWNNVFNQYFQDKTGHLGELEYQGVDTGMGLERLVMVIQKKSTIFETDLFTSLINLAKSNSSLPNDRSGRIIADHIRGIVFLITDSVLPSNTKQGYILRRLIRRFSTHLDLIGAKDTVINALVDQVEDLLGDWYKKLDKAKPRITNILSEERTKFSYTLTHATKQLETIKSLAKDKIIDGSKIYDLQSTYGLPTEITRELINRSGYTIDEEGLKKAMEEHQDISRG